MKESFISKGRIGVYVPTHPKCNNRGYILRYRYIMEKYLNRYLDEWEQVHHCDGNKINDSIENLELMTISDHTKLHQNWNSKRKRGSKRKLDYDLIKKYRSEGWGYKKISKKTGFCQGSVKSAIKRIIDKELMGTNMVSMEARNI